MASTSVFDYGDQSGNTSVGGDGKSLNDQQNALELLENGSEGAWKATSKQALNDCANKTVWQIDVLGKSGTGGAAFYKASITPPSGAVTDCEALTPSFKKLDTSAGAT